MNKITKIMLAGLLTCGSVSLASVSTTFTSHSTDTTLRNLATITLDYTIDGTGNVTLDASTSNGGAVPTEIPNLWDNDVSVGGVTVASLWGTTFSLTGVSTAGGFISSTGPNPGLGILGSNNNRIDGAGAEAMTWTYAGVAGSSLNFIGVDFASRVAHGNSNFRLIDSDTDATHKLTPFVDAAGTLDLVGDGYSLASGDGFIITTSTTLLPSTVGAALDGFSFEVVPEPATMGLFAIFGAGILFIRRNFRI